MIYNSGFMSVLPCSFGFEFAFQQQRLNHQENRHASPPRPIDFKHHTPIVVPICNPSTYLATHLGLSIRENSTAPHLAALRSERNFFYSDLYVMQGIIKVYRLFICKPSSFAVRSITRGHIFLCLCPKPIAHQRKFYSISMVPGGLLVTVKHVSC
jgi:hypothetical protein